MYSRILFFFISVALSFNVFADSVSGVAEFDSSSGELKIPCVKVKNLSSEINGLYFDVILKSNDENLVFQLSFAESEDSSLCDSVDNFAKFEDVDFSESANDDDSGNDDTENNSVSGLIRLRCEVRSDRSKVSVDGKGLTEGQYFTAISSGNNSAESSLQSTNFGEVEFDFDSAPDDIASGDAAIDAGFIQNNRVLATILNESGEVIASTEVNCIIE